MTRTQSMASTATNREGPSYSSTRVQRAARLNNVEATKLLQQLQCLEKAKQHQTRLTNQDIRMVSMSIDYIQAHSGNSQEAWRPPPPPKAPSTATPPAEDTDTDTDGNGNGNEGISNGNAKPEGPCFMYGERIISRKVRRLTRPMSAVERTLGKSYHKDDDDSNSTSTCDDSTDNGPVIQRPKSSCSHSSKMRASSSMSWLKLNDSHTDDNDKNAIDYILNTGRSAYISSRPSSAMSSFTREREPWEDDTSEITKKILKSQARAQMGKRNSVYQPAGAVLNSQSSKKVRDLARKIRITSTQISYDGIDPSTRRQSHPGLLEDKPPRRPSTAKDFLGRRATFGEIMNQQKPTLSAGAWRQHLSKNSQATPMSASAQQKAMLDAKKQFNDTCRANVAEKVRDFIGKKSS